MSKEITNISIDVLKVHPRNTEFFDDISGNEYEEFKHSIQEEGIISEIIVAPDMTIISGHQRYKAAKELGIKMVPIRIREDLVDEDKKLKVLLAANFGRSKNNEAKQRKIAVEYVRLCGYKNGGDRKSDSQDGNVKLTLEEIAKQLGTSKTNLTRALSIERNLTEPMKNLLDDGIISKTVASDLIASLSPEEQEELIKNLDVTKKITKIQMQSTIDAMKLQKDAEIADCRSDLDEMKGRYSAEIEKNKLLQGKIDEYENKTPEKQLKQQICDSCFVFASRVAAFLEDVGGYVWLSTKINEMSEVDRNGYLVSLQLVKDWVYTLEYNINKDKGDILV